MAPTPLPEAELDELIDRLLLPNPRRKFVRLDEKEILRLCLTARQSFLEEGTLLRLQSPVKICGDIHGQYFDLLRLFEVGGSPLTTPYLFLGDYVDRGKNSLEVICLLLALKSRYPRHIHLIRGNHEMAPINRIFGFFDEVKRRFREEKFMKLFLKLNDTFNYMPIAATIDGSVFCCHGGISPRVESLTSIDELQRPIYPSKDGLASDILWSDPDDIVNVFEKQNKPEENPKHRGIGYLWGIIAHDEFMRRNHLKLMIRAHQCVQRGYEWAFNRSLLTLFSAPNYSKANHAAIANCDRNGSISLSIFK